MTFTQIKNKVYFLTKTNSSSFPIGDLVAEVNNACERVSSLIMQADGRWQWDDKTQSDLPIATTDIVSAQQDYTFAVSHLVITRMELKDEDGNWHLLKSIDQADVYDQSLTDFMKTQGVPIFYDKIANSIFLYPTPNFSQDDSLKTYFKRGPVAFTTASDGESPGFSSLYHELVPLWVAYNFLMANGRKSANQVSIEIQRREQAMQDDYALRNKDEHIKLEARQGHSFR